MVGYIVAGISFTVMLLVIFMILRESKWYQLLLNKNRALRSTTIIISKDPNLVLRRYASVFIFAVIGITAIFLGLNGTYKYSNTEITNLTSKNHLQFIMNDLNNRNGISNIFRNIGGNMAKDTLEDSAEFTDNLYGSIDNQIKYGGSNYSETNLQVQGVDEADIVKTDGDYIYTTIHGQFIVTKAITIDQLAIVENISYEDENFYPTELYVSGNHIVVIGNSHRFYQVEDDKINEEDNFNNEYRQNVTKIYIYEKETWEELKTIIIDGNYVNSRRINEDVYIITNKYINTYLFYENDIDINPRVDDNGDVEFVNYSDMKYINDTNPNSFINVAGFSLNNLSKDISIETYVGSGYEVYSSKENMYLITNLYNREDRHNYTGIIKFGLNNAEPKVIASTKIPGRINNQFSMDEHNGSFRIAVTKGWSQLSENNLHIFDSGLNEVGSLKGENCLAPGESIKSVRYMGDRIYIVTFRQVDPLFVIDAKNPTNPKVIGKLKIPGFSTYLHPYDDNHLIGIGYNTDTIGITTGLKIALFDVTNPERPIEKHKTVYDFNSNGWASTEATYNHKAILFSKERELLAFPLSCDEGGHYQQGYVVFNINLVTGFTEKDFITHITSDNDSDEYYYNKNYIQRGLYINNYLYTVSEGKIQVNELSNLEKVTDITLPESKNNYVCYGCGWYHWRYWNDEIEPATQVGWD